MSVVDENIAFYNGLVQELAGRLDFVLQAISPVPATEAGD